MTEEKKEEHIENSTFVMLIFVGIWVGIMIMATFFSMHSVVKYDEKENAYVLKCNSLSQNPDGVVKCSRNPKNVYILKERHTEPFGDKFVEETFNGKFK